MNTQTPTYYDKEFSQLEALPLSFQQTVQTCMKLQNEHGATRWMNVTPEQISAILEILNKTEKG